MLVWVVWRFADRETLRDTFVNAAPVPIAIAILLNVVVIYFKVSRWRMLLAAVDVLITFTEALRAFMPSVYLGLVTPGRVGDLGKRRQNGSATLAKTLW